MLMDMQHNSGSEDGSDDGSDDGGSDCEARGGDDTAARESLGSTLRDLSDDLSALLSEFGLDDVLYRAIFTACGGDTFAHVVRCGERGLTSAGVSKLQARKLFKAAVQRAKASQREATGSADEESSPEPEDDAGGAASEQDEFELDDAAAEKAAAAMAAVVAMTASGKEDQEAEDSGADGSEDGGSRESEAIEVTSDDDTVGEADDASVLLDDEVSAGGRGIKIFDDGAGLELLEAGDGLAAEAPMAMAEAALPASRVDGEWQAPVHAFVFLLAAD